MRSFRSVSRASTCAFTSAGLLALVLLTATAPPAAGQPAGGAQQPSIAGRVTAQESGAPLPESRVLVIGTSIFTTTNADGRYTLRNVPAGPVTLRVLRVGYNEQKRAVTVAPGQTLTVDFPLARAIVQLQEVVTTATGDQRRVELGHSVSTVDAVKKVDQGTVKNMGDLLTAQAPGVQVLPGNMTGAGSRVRVRGTSSISLSNDPIYIIDGIRMTGTGSNLASAIGVGGTTQSRVNDIDPEQIENIEIVKGPSAATLYGTDAANGVIVITTKKGRAGRPQWSVFGDYGAIRDENHYPTQYAILGHLPATPTVARKCLLKELSAKTCIMDSTSSVNVFEDPELTPIKPGNRGQVGAQLQGGTDAVRYFLSGDYQREYGPFGFPEFDRPRFAAAKVDILDEWERPNALSQGSYRANLNAAVGPTLDLAVQAGFTNLTQRLPQVDNNVNSFWYNGTVGPGFQSAGPGYTGIGSLGQPLRGYASYTPGDIFQFLTTQDIQRFIGGTNANWRPTSWLAVRGETGVDLTDRADFSLCRLGQCSDFGTNRQGFATDARANIRNFTANLGATGSWQALASLNVKTTAGAQYVNFNYYGNYARGSQLPPGAQVPSAGTIPNVSNNAAGTTLQKTLGIYVEEALAFRDRLFATAAVRTDQNSAFGTNFQRVYYPKASLSWLLSEEPFFPKPGWLDQLRLRTAYGASGVQPGPNDADRTFQVTTTNIAATDVSGLRSNQLGNENIKPERSTEFEAGFESRGLGGRVSLDVTYYRKQTRDALIAMPLAPSAGAQATSILTNLGAVRNWGYEGLLNAQVLSGRVVSWDLTVSAAHNSNRLITLGTDASGVPIPTIGTGTNRQAEGYPLNSTWTRKFTYADANGDGLITPNEVVVDTAFTYLGYSQPRLEMSLTSGLGLFRDRVRLTALVDHKSGYYVSNTEQSFLCQQSTSCKGTSSLDATLWEQARAVAIRDGVPSTPHGYYEKPNFWRIREVSATYSFADQTARRYLRVRGASITAAARNVHVFTDWTGVDPEQNYGNNDTQNTLLTAGPPRYYTARVNLRF